MPVAPNRRALFLALAEEGDLKRAATRCKVTQRRIRDAVNHLEAEYGARLFVIETKTATLTEAGGRLRYSLSWGGADDIVVRNIKVLLDTMSGHGMAEWMGAAASQLWPNLRIEISRAHVSQQIKRLDLGLADVAMIYGWPTLPHPDLAFLRLYDQEVVAFIGQGPNKPKPEFFPVADIRGKTWVLPPPFVMPRLSSLLTWESRKSGFNPKRISAPTVSQLLDLVRSRVALGFAPASFLPVLPADVIKVRFEPRMAVPFGCLYRTHEASTSVHRFLNLCSRLTNPKHRDGREVFPDQTVSITLGSDAFDADACPGERIETQPVGRDVFWRHQST